MKTIAQLTTNKTATRVRAKRSVSDLLAPLNQLAETSVNLIAKPFGRFEMDGESFELPRYLFIGPRGGDEPIGSACLPAFTVTSRKACMRWSGF